MRAERHAEEPSCCSEIAPRGDEHIDDLTVLIDRSVDVSPFAGDLHVGLVDEPPVADRVSARSGRIGEEWREALHPPVDGDVIDLDPTLAEQLFDIAVGEPVPQIPTHREDDDLRREPEPDERRTRRYGHRTETTRPHLATLTVTRDLAPMQQCPEPQPCSAGLT